VEIVHRPPRDRGAPVSDERFHIGHWHRVKPTRHKVGGSALTRAELTRIAAPGQQAAHGAMTPRHPDRLTGLRAKRIKPQTEELPCPFRADSQRPACTGPGGVCLIRFLKKKRGVVAPIDGNRGRLRSLCPWRLHQDGTAFDRIGEAAAL
jgi:hypothetical protein